MKRKVHLGTWLLLVIGLYANAQDIVWTGSAANNDFLTKETGKIP